MNPRIIVKTSQLRRGAVAILVAISLVALCGVMSLAIDAGVLMGEKRRAQTVADAAAHAAACSLYKNYAADKGLDPSGSAKKAALAIAADNGYANDSIKSLVTMYTPPISGTHLGKSGYVEVVAKNSQSAMFSGVFGKSSLSVNARAVARGTSIAYSKAAIIVLAPTGTSVTLSGSTQITAVGGSVVVNSSSSSSITSSGSPSITAPQLNLSGNITYSGNNPNHSTTTNFSQPLTPDPLASIAAPSPSSMTTQSSSAISLSGSQTRVLNPGVYNGGLTLSGSSAVTLNPGIYYMNGGISLSGSSGITANGVFIYNTGGAINLSGSGTIALSPMSTGDYTGLTIFQDRASSTGATMSGGTNINNTGTFYFPNAPLTLSGSSGVAVVGAQLIAKTLTFSGSAGVKAVYDASVASSAGIAIVE